MSRSLNYSSFLHTKGCLVVTPDEQPALVQQISIQPHSVTTQIKLLESRLLSWRPVAELKSGLKPGMEVEHVPSLRTQVSLGIGEVRDLQQFGDRMQVLVEYPETGKVHWMPHERLKPVPGVRQRFLSGRQRSDSDAERIRLRSLARALESWNENTGTLSNLDIDPLPHQIHLVHHILRSGNLNWMIADDVGLGKTIEVGMLLSALSQRGNLRKVLIVVPAGLVRQWKEEMRHKFGFKDFRIFGIDFNIDYPDDWRLYPFVIGSMDRLKQQENLELLSQAGNWDLIIFDEAHRLSRRQWGARLTSTERYRLAAQLRHFTDSILLLTATPHQGMQDKFQALLELLRPDLKDEILTLSVNPEILSEVVFRNQKSEVIDHQGNLIFNGKDTNSVRVDINDDEVEFDQNLQQYLKAGYGASALKGDQGRVVGFVMTVYRKLASSSHSAIEKALIRRKKRLEEQYSEEFIINPEEKDDIDSRFIGEWEEQIGGGMKEFFTGERELLQKLILKAGSLKAKDSKIKVLRERILTPILKDAPDRKILIFTEYRATQDFLSGALLRDYGEKSVVTISGGQSFEERERAIHLFETEARFLISTEAGGEGINLQRRCHIMVNYDLPWNPMRMVQRLGRLYRYGQHERVIVFNLQAPQTFDSNIVELMYQRLEDVSRDMASLGEGFQEGMADEILGELSEALDVEELLEQSRNWNRQRSEEEIKDAILKAKEAVDLQRELFSNALGFNRDEITDSFKIDTPHLKAFLEGMLHYFKIEVTDQTQAGRIWHLRIPEKVMAELPGVRSTIMRVTTDRTLANRFSQIEMFDFSHPLMQFFVQKVRASSFGGYFAYARIPRAKVLVSAMLRWQSESGQRMREEFVGVQINSNGQVFFNTKSFSEWLLSPAESIANIEGDDEKESRDNAASKSNSEVIDEALESRLVEYSNQRIYPQNLQWVASLACPE